MNKRKVKIALTSLITCVILGMSNCGENPAPHVHDYSGEWKKDEDNHWHVCLSCGEIGDLSSHTFASNVIEPDYEHGGYTRHECTVCHYYYDTDQTSPKEHQYSSVYSFNEYNHWRACTDIGYEDLKIDYDVHDLGEWIIDYNPTSVSLGHRHKECSICDYTLEEDFSIEAETERVYIATQQISLFNGYTRTLAPVVIPDNAIKNIKYEVVDPTIVRISSNGEALATKVGSTLVYIYNDVDNDNVRDSEEKFTVMAFSITEPDSTKYVDLEERSITLKVGQTSEKLHYSLDSFYKPNYTAVGFYSENTDICTIAAGYIKAHRPGTTRVSVSYEGYRAYCDVIVENLTDEQGLRAYEIESASSLKISKGDTSSVFYQILPVDSIDELATVSTNNPRILRVNADKTITGLEGGSAIVTLTTTNGKSSRTLVTVKDNANLTDNYYNNYYGDLSWKNGEDLANKLHDIISKDVNHIKYVKGSSNHNWISNIDADQDLYDHSYVFGAYSDDPILKTYAGVDTIGWQKEHAFAASLMTGFTTGDAVKADGRASDFHNLFAALSGANGSRGNANFGYVDTDRQDAGSYSNCLRLNKQIFEPADSDKGRMARAIFYMGLMYNDIETVDITQTWTYSGDDIPAHPDGKSKTVHVNVDEQGLRLIEDTVDYDRISINSFMNPTDEAVIKVVEYYRSIIDKEQPDLREKDYDLFRELAYERYVETAMPYSIGHFSDLLKWNSYDVDLLEMQHNQSVHSFDASGYGGVQGNRNPFVDYPQLVDYVYGDLSNQPGSLKELTPSYLSLEMDKDEIHHYAVESEELEAFISGTKPQASDFNLKAIKNDLSEGVLDLSKIHVEDYTFTDEDVLTGKVITIETDKNTLKVPVKVVSESVVTFDNSKFSYAASGGNRSSYSPTNDNTQSYYVATFSGVQFDVTFGKATTTFQNRSKGGVTIGSGNNPIGSLTIESKLSYENINAAFVYASASQDMKITYKIYVDDVEKYSGLISGNVPVKTGGSFIESSGKLRIVFSGVNGIIFVGLAFNY